ncbi:unnamed protein product, partial [marine sediment metagenome]
EYYIGEKLKKEYRNNFIASLGNSYINFLQFQAAEKAVQARGGDKNQLGIGQHTDENAAQLYNFLCEDARLKASDDKLSLWKSFLFGKYGNIIIFTKGYDNQGNPTGKFHYNGFAAMDSLIAIYADARGRGDIRMEVELGSATQKFTSTQTGTNPNKTPRLRDLAMRLHMAHIFGGVEPPITMNPFKAGNIYSIGPIFGTSYDTPEKMRDYIIENKKLPPDWKWPQETSIQELTIQAFTMDKDEKQFLEQLTSLKQAMLEARVELLVNHAKGIEPLTEKQLRKLGQNP